MPLTLKLVHSILKKNGWQYKGQKGSHQKRRKTGRYVIVPEKKELPPGTALSILKDIARGENTTVAQLKKEWNIKL